MMMQEQKVVTAAVSSFDCYDSAGAANIRLFDDIAAEDDFFTNLMTFGSSRPQTTASYGGNTTNSHFSHAEAEQAASSNGVMQPSNCFNEDNMAASTFSYSDLSAERKFCSSAPSTSNSSTQHISLGNSHDSTGISDAVQRAVQNQILSSSSALDDDVQILSATHKSKTSSVSTFHSEDNSVVANVNGNSLPLQFVVQAQLQTVQTSTGIVTVAVVPSSVMKPMVMQMQQQNGRVSSPALKQPPKAVSPALSNPGTPSGVAGGSAKIRKIQPKPHAQQPYARVNSVPQIKTVSSAKPERKTSEPVTVELDPESQRKMDEYGKQLAELRASAGHKISPSQREDAIKGLEKKRAQLLTQAFYQQQQKTGMTVVRQQILPQNPLNNVASSFSQSPVLPPDSESQVVQINGQSYLMVVPKATENKVVQPPPPQSVSVFPNQSQGIQHVFSNAGSFFVAQTASPKQNEPLQQSVPLQPFTQQLPYNLYEGSSEPSKRISASLSGKPHSSTYTERTAKIRTERKVQRQARLKRCFEKDCESLVEPSQRQVPFASPQDAIVRLLPYHLQAEPEYSESFFRRADDGYRNCVADLYSKMEHLTARFRDSLLKEAMAESSSYEECLLHYLAQQNEGDLLESERNAAKQDLEGFVRKSKILAANEETALRVQNVVSQYHHAPAVEAGIVQESPFSQPVTSPLEVKKESDTEDLLPTFSREESTEGKVVPIRVFLKRKRNSGNTWEARSSSARKNSNSESSADTSVEDDGTRKKERELPSAPPKIPRLRIKLGRNGPVIATEEASDPGGHSQRRKLVMSCQGLESSDSEDSESVIENKLVNELQTSSAKKEVGDVECPPLSPPDLDDGNEDRDLKIMTDSAVKWLEMEEAVSTVPRQLNNGYHETHPCEQKRVVDMMMFREGTRQVGHNWLVFGETGGCQSPSVSSDFSEGSDEADTAVQSILR